MCWARSANRNSALTMPLRAAFARALELANQAGDALVLGRACNNLGMIANLTGRREEALQMLEFSMNHLPCAEGYLWVLDHPDRVGRVVVRLYMPDKEQTARLLGLDYVADSALVVRAIAEKIGARLS